MSEPGTDEGRASAALLVERASGAGLGSAAGASSRSLVPAEAGCCGAEGWVEGC
ncbi:hypothetical protein [Georgenia sp. Marseille-Q6866]